MTTHCVSYLQTQAPGIWAVSHHEGESATAANTVSTNGDDLKIAHHVGEETSSYVVNNVSLGSIKLEQLHHLVKPDASTLSNRPLGK